MASDDLTTALSAGKNKSPSTRTTIDFARPDSLVGQRLEDRFLIQKNLTDTGADVGGLGVVFLARDEKLLGRQVVVKILNEEALKFNDIVRKFLHEKEALVRLDHPGIVKILDSGSLADGNPFIVMEYISGQSLRKALKRNQVIPLHLAGNIIKALTDALAAAHAKDVLHRDIKPENIMLTPVEGDYDRVRLIDFGIAKVGNPQLAPETQTSRAIGTVLYIAPEQLIGRADITAAADIYSSAIVAYELLTGELPFQPKTMADMYHLQSEGIQATPRKVRPDIPPAAEQLLLSALEFQPEKRPQNARTFGRELAKALTDGQSAEPISISTDEFMHSIQTEFDPRLYPQSEPDSDLPPTEIVELVPTTPEPGNDSGRRKFALMGMAGAILVSALLLSAVGVGLYFSRTDKPPVTETPSAPAQAAPELQLTYFLLVQKVRNKKAFEDPFPSAGNYIYESGYQFWLNFQADRDGHLYLINEGPGAKGAIDHFALFPFPTTVGKDEVFDARMKAGQMIKTKVLTFGGGTGTETFWIIWTKEDDPELAKIIRSASRTSPGGQLPAQSVESLRSFVEAHAAEGQGSVVTMDEKNILRAQGDVVVHRLDLQHR